MTQDTERWTIWRARAGEQQYLDPPTPPPMIQHHYEPIEVVPASSLQEVEREALLRIERQARDRYKAGDHESHGEMMAAHAARMEVVAEQAKACAREVERERDELREALRGPIHGRIQTARGWCSDEVPYPELDAYLATLDDIVAALSNPKEEQ